MQQDTLFRLRTELRWIERISTFSKWVTTRRVDADGLLLCR
jgi:hypothetical protein